MNFKTIGIVISREYLNRVKKKSFIWTTILVPILVAGLTIGIMLAMMNTKDKVKTIAVADASGIVLPYMTDTETIHYKDAGDQPLDAALHGRHQARMREGVQRCRGGRCKRHIPTIRGTDHAHAVGIRLEAAAELRRAESFGGIERDALGTGPECVVHFLKDSFGRSAKFRIQPAEKRGTRILVALVHDCRVIGELRIMRIKVRIDHREHIVEIPVVKTLVNHELGDLFRREGGCHHLLGAGMGFVRHLVGHLRDHVAAEAAPDRIA